MFCVTDGIRIAWCYLFFAFSNQTDIKSTTTMHYYYYEGVMKKESLLS